MTEPREVGTAPTERIDRKPEPLPSPALEPFSVSVIDVRGRIVILRLSDHLDPAVVAKLIPGVGNAMRAAGAEAVIALSAGSELETFGDAELAKVGLMRIPGWSPPASPSGEQSVQPEGIPGP